MHRFHIQHLQYNYTWKPGNTTTTSSRPINLSEGFDVLAMINRFMADHHLYTVATGQKIEKLVKEQLPPRTNGYDDIRKWLYKHL